MAQSPKNEAVRQDARHEADEPSKHEEPAQPEQSELDKLIAAADKLRPLHEDDPEKEPLASIVDRINALRAIEAAEKLKAT
jgi:hypothetical protein